MHIDLRPETTTSWLEKMPEDFKSAMPCETLVTIEEAEEIRLVLEALPSDSNIVDRFKSIQEKIPSLSRAERMNFICTLVKDENYAEYCRLNAYLSEEEEGGNGGAAIVLEDLASMAGVLGNRLYSSLDVIEMMTVIQESVAAVHGADDAPQNFM